MFTPGPYRVEIMHGEPFVMSDHAPDGYSTLQAHVIGNDGDAQLLAAAPDLLAACETVLRAIEWSTPDERLTSEEQADVLRAAIGQAKGD